MKAFIHRMSETEVMTVTMVARRPWPPIADPISLPHWLHGQILRWQALPDDGNKSRMPILMHILPRGKQGLISKQNELNVN